MSEKVHSKIYTFSKKISHLTKQYSKQVYIILEELCYKNGLAVLRFFRFFRLRFHATIILSKKKISFFSSKIKRKTSNLFQKIKKNILIDVSFFYKKTKDFIKIINTRIAEKRKEAGTLAAFQELIPIFKEGYGKNRRYIQKIFNILAPLACACGFFLLVNGVFSLDYVLNVEYNGQHIGVVDNEKQFDKAKSNMLAQIVFEDKREITNQQSQFSVSVKSPIKEIKSEELTQAMISASGEKIEEGFGIYVDDTFVVSSKNKTLIETVLQENLRPYQEKYQGAEISYQNNIEIVPGLYPTNSIKNDEEVASVLTGNIQDQVLYTVTHGDTPLIIAAKNNISLAQLKAYNPNIVDLMIVGVKVVVGNEKEFLPVQVVRSETYTETLAYTTEEIKNSNYFTGYEKVQREGENGENRITASVSYVDGVENSRTILESTVVKTPVNKQVVVGTAVKNSGSGKASTYSGAITVKGSGKLAWPAAGGYVSNGYLGYYNHKAIDIAANSGTAIYAADDGVVTTSGWSNSGYGNYIVINHGNGMQTLYAHNSKNVVRPGQVVSRGQLIGHIGSTGNSSGNHVHFEVIVNGVKQNPSRYLS